MTIIRTDKERNMLLYKNSEVGEYPKHLQTKRFDSERHRQMLHEERHAYGCGSRVLRVWTYECVDGEEFSAIAQTESGALRVLNSERPGMQAKFVGQSTFKFRN